MCLQSKINAYDAQKRRFLGGVLKEHGGQVAFVQESDFPYDVPLYIVPGFVDMHVHFFDGYGIFGMHASRFGHKWGVHVMSDAGSCGVENIEAFFRYILPTYQGVVFP